MKKFYSTIITVALALGVFIVPALAVQPVGATPASSILDGAEQASGSSRTDTKQNVAVRFGDITKIILFILGAIAVIMIIIGGIRYVISGGDGTAVTGAKNTIFYAVIGLIVAILAFAIVNFVTKNVGA